MIDFVFPAGAPVTTSTGCQAPPAISTSRWETETADVGIVRGRDVRHAAAEAEPAGQRQDQRALHLERAEIERDAERFRQPAKLRRTKLDRRNVFSIVLGEQRRDVESIAARRMHEGT